MGIQLRGGVETSDIRLDRVPQFDERSRNYPIRATIAATEPKSRSWPVKTWLDQGQEGACVGFGWSHELAASPMPIKGLDYDFALNKVYKEAQKIDEWAGEDYEGTSVLAGAKVVSSLGYMGEYRWAFGLDDLIMAVGHSGPAVIGVNWYNDMFYPDEKGFLHASGELAGGHCILVRSVAVKRGHFTLHNSWGRDWGHDGTAKISFADMDKLLQESGEACIPVQRKKI